jgi:hypothetical protein
VNGPFDWSSLKSTSSPAWQCARLRADAPRGYGRSEQTSDDTGRLDPLNHLVSLFNASDDTVEMVSTHPRSGFNYVVGCHFSDLKRATPNLSRH